MLEHIDIRNVKFTAARTLSMPSSANISACETLIRQMIVYRKYLVRAWHLACHSPRKSGRPKFCGHGGIDARLISCWVHYWGRSREWTRLVTTDMKINKRCQHHFMVTSIAWPKCEARDYQSRAASKSPRCYHRDGVRQLCHEHCLDITRLRNESSCRNRRRARIRVKLLPSRCL